MEFPVLRPNVQVTASEKELEKALNKKAAGKAKRAAARAVRMLIAEKTKEMAAADGLMGLSGI